MKMNKTSCIYSLPFGGGLGRGARGAIWLILELILVTMACWWAFDPVIVSTYTKYLPLGFDAERIVKVDVGNPFNYEDEWNYSIEINNETEILCKKIQEMDEVEFASLGDDYNQLGFVTRYQEAFYNGNDSLYACKLSFSKDSKIFQIMGVESLTPSVPTNELTSGCEPEECVIITRSMAMALYGTIDVAGRTIKGRMYIWNDKKRKTEYVIKPFRIHAVVEDVRSDLESEDYCIAFVCGWGSSYNPIIVRLRDGVNAERFIEQYKREMQHSLKTEHCYIRNMQSSIQYIKEKYESGWTGRRAHRNLLIAAFFACNLTFGVIGTLLMYTRQRKEEAGVKMAFGATRLSIFLGFLREAWLITTFSVLIGCIFYFQLAYASGLYVRPVCYQGNHYWFDSFGTHFLVVSLCVYLIILCFVLLGTIIPAWRISRSKITEALKE
jgi:hypothetical protein